jgi:cytochrome bd-type quinol oxidase subunit 2
MKHDKLSDYAGWLGIASIQGATMPSIVGSISGHAQQMPPLSMVALVWLGLVLFLYRGIVRSDTVAIVSNTIGFVLNTILLAIIVYPAY